MDKRKSLECGLRSSAGAVSTNARRGLLFNSAITQPFVWENFDVLAL